MIVKVIIMMSTYNGEKFISEQLDSILEQSISDFITLIIRDDGSSDKTKEIIEQYQKKYSNIIVNYSNNIGPAKSFRKLINLVSDADYYAFADQDDIWDRDKLKIGIDLLNREQNKQKPLLYFSNARLIDSENNSFNRNFHMNVPNVSIPSVLVCCCALGCTMIFNKIAIDKVKNANYTAFPMHDQIMLLSVLSCGKVIYDEIPHIHYRLHKDNVTIKIKSNLSSKLKKTFRLWLCNHNNSVQIQARDLLTNFKDNIGIEDNLILKWLSNYKTNIYYRFKLLFDKRIKCMYSRATRSFKIRILIGLA